MLFGIQDFLRDCFLYFAFGAISQARKFELGGGADKSLARQARKQATAISNFRRVLNILCFFLGSSRRLNYICRRFGTLYLFLHLHRHLPMKMEQIVCSETSAYIIQTPGKYPKRKHNIMKQTEVGECLLSIGAEAFVFPFVIQKLKD